MELHFVSLITKVGKVRLSVEKFRIQKIKEQLFPSTHQIFWLSTLSDSSRNILVWLHCGIL